MKIDELNNAIRLYFTEHNENISPIELDGIVAQINRVMNTIVIEHDLVIPQDSLVFDDAFDLVPGITLASKVDLEPYPHEALMYAFEQLMKSDTNFENEMHVHRWVCKVADTYCDKYQMKPNWSFGRKLSKKLNITTSMQRGIPFPQRQVDQEALMLLVKLSSVSKEKILSGRVTTEEWVAVTNAASKIQELSIEEKTSLLNE